MPDGVYAPVKPMQSTGLHPPCRGIFADADSPELPNRHDSVLAAGYCRKRPIPHGAFPVHCTGKSPDNFDSPPATPELFATTVRRRYFGGREAATEQCLERIRHRDGRPRAPNLIR